MTFRKLSADSAGAVLRKYFTENTPEPSHEVEKERGPRADAGGRLTAYYTGRDSRASWRPDMPAAVAKVLGIDPITLPGVRSDRVRAIIVGQALFGQSLVLTKYFEFGLDIQNP